MNARVLRTLINIYPPFLGSGIKVKKITDDYREIVVEMKLKFYNKNYVKTHFGGSLFAMCDPFYMLMLINILGKDYIVWDKSACIEFIKPGTGSVSAIFRLSQEQINEIIEKCSMQGKCMPEYVVDILNENNDIVAKVRKVIYIKKRV